MEKESRYDAIVIGSGIGGLAAAAVLARVKRYRVLVLEQHFKLGGFTHTFQRPGGFHWDVGLHYVGKMAPGSPLRAAMDFITAGKTDWVQMKDPFDVFLYPDFKFEVPSSRNSYWKKLTALFPSETDSLRGYFKDVELAANKFMGQLQMPPESRALAGLTVKAYLDSHFREERLKSILASQWGDYGLPPHLASFGVHAGVVRHYLEGGYYPVGSAAALVEDMAGVVREAGGDLKVRHKVLSIVVEENQAKGVEVETSAGREVIYASEIYSDAGAETTYKKLLGGKVTDAEELKRLGSVPLYSVVTLYMGLKSRCEHLGIHGQNLWIFDGFDHDAVWERRNRLADGKASSCGVSFPGIKDPAAKKVTAEIIAPLDYSVFEKWKDTRWMNRGVEYQNLKKKISEALMDFVEGHLPGFREEVVFSELSTPLSDEYFTGHREGGIYGFPGIPGRYEMRSLGPKTPVKGLTLVGTDAAGHGITGAMMGGFLGVSVQHGQEIFLRVFQGN